MGSERTFRVLWPYRRDQAEAYAAAGVPERVPWSIMLPHARQAHANHQQTLECLHDRGGLSACEMAAVLSDQRWRKRTPEESVAIIRKHMEATDAK